MKIPEMNYKKMVYPSILIVIIIVIIVAALLATKFLTANINSSFNTNESVLRAEVIKIDMESYKLTAKKLGIQYPVTPDKSTAEPPRSEGQQ